MANNTAAVKELTVDARFIMSSYERKDGSKVDFVSCELIDPFNEEIFRNIRLKAKWDKFDDKNRLVRPDRVFGWMSFYAEKALKTQSEIPVKVTIKPVTYKSKKTGEMVTYPALFADPTFIELEDERPVELVVKDPNDANKFLLLASIALGIKFTPKDPSDDDAGLMD